MAEARAILDGADGAAPGPKRHYPGRLRPPRPNGVDLSVILPTYNERPALEALAPRLERSVAPYEAEFLVVDDGSPDGTEAWVRSRGATGRWRLIERGARLGLATAVVAGIEQARGEIVVVMDADGSHPPETIPRLVEPVRSGRAELALASRFVPGGADPGLAGWRRAISWGATELARPLTSVRDPKSGFFATRRELFGRARLAPTGYKIGLEVLVRCRPAPVAEVPFVFAPRLAGESKLGARQIGSYVRHVGRLYLFRAFGGGRASSTR